MSNGDFLSIISREHIGDHLPCKTILMSALTLPYLSVFVEGEEGRGKNKTWLLVTMFTSQLLQNIH